MAEGQRWLWFWCTVVSGWEADAKRRVAELFGRSCRAKSAAGQVRWRVESDCCSDASAFGGRLEQLRDVGVEYVFLRIADCSLARQRRRRAPEPEPEPEPERQEEEDDHDDDGSDEGDGGDGEDSEDDGVCESEGGGEATSWRLARICETSRSVPPSLLRRAVSLWRASDRQQQQQQQQPSGGSGSDAAERPVLFRVSGKRGGKGHDFSSDDVKRHAARGLIGSEAACAAQLQPALSGFDVTVRAQVHRKSFVLGFPMRSEPFHRHQGRRFGTAATPSEEAQQQDHEQVAAAAPPRAREKRRKSSAEVALSDWLPAHLAELQAAAADDPDTITSLAFPRSARDLATPLHEMEYTQQVREAWLRI